VFAYAAHQHPEHAAVISRVLTIPSKRHQRSDVIYLDTGEVAALLRGPTELLGRDAGITPCCRRPSPPACGSPELTGDRRAAHPEITVVLRDLAVTGSAV
jgi:hypothetical protein